MRDDTVTDVVGYMEGFVGGTGRLVRLPVRNLPCRIGRRLDAEIQLSDPRVSQHHAEIFRVGDDLKIRDLNSTNGTFLNDKPVKEDLPLEHGDVVRLANLEFRFVSVEGDSSQKLLENTSLISPDASGDMLVFSNRDILRMVESEAVTPYFQPIIELETNRLAGFEILGRGNLEGLPSNPYELFKMASTFGMEPVLSELFRTVGVRVGSQMPGHPPLFVNMHPTEAHGTQLIHSLQELRAEFPKQPITLEIHESAVTDSELMRQLRSELSALDMQLAYDDFGAGMSRLKELAEVPPDFIKFDASLIRDIHVASPATQQLVRTLVQMADDFGAQTLAEGIETSEERDLCRDIGFSLGQGYLFGAPTPIGGHAAT